MGMHVVWVWCEYGVGMIWGWFGYGMGMVEAWCGCGVGIIWVWFGYSMKMVWYGYGVDMVWVGYGDGCSPRTPCRERMVRLGRRVPPSHQSPPHLSPFPLTPSPLHFPPPAVVATHRPIYTLQQWCGQSPMPTPPTPPSAPRALKCPPPNRFSAAGSQRWSPSPVSRVCAQPSIRGRNLFKLPGGGRKWGSTGRPPGL